MSLDIVIYFAILTLVILNGIVKFSRLTIPFRALTLLILVIFLSEITARILAVKIRNSNPPYHILVILQYAATSFIYSRLITGWRLHRFILFSAIPFGMLCIINTLFAQHFFSFPSYSIMLSYIIFIIFALILFLQMLDSPKEIAIAKQSVFWFNCATLVYSVAVPVCFGVLSYLINHKFNSDIISTALEYFTFIYYLALGYAIHIDKKQSGRHTNEQTKPGY